MGVREDQRRRTVAAIVGAAAEEFADRGYQGTSYRSIADRAGVAKSLVSYHFSSKSDIAVAVSTVAFRNGVYADTPVQQHDPLAEIAVSTVLVGVRTLVDPVARAEVRLERERLLIDAALPEPFVGWIDRTADALTRAVSLGELDPCIDVQAQSRLLVAQYMGLREVSTATAELDQFVERALAGTLERLALLGARPENLARIRRTALDALPEDRRW